jgi:hypothetical protein
VAEQIEAKVEARRKELGVADDLKEIPGTTTFDARRPREPAAALRR